VVPIAMWVASLIVAFLALDRLAIKHIRKLGRQMRRFALNRTMPRVTLAPSVPTELVEMESAFLDMAESILRDEATQEDRMRQKNILLKEVHHRVKNNLQLISSIMNMQIRQANTAESKFALQRLQERLLSLATVHENLYKDDNLTRVDASTLMREIVTQLLTVGLAAGTNVEVKQHYDQISLDPDDAAPLTLLTTEAVTNALKYVAQPTSEKPFISISLIQDAPERATLRVENTVGSDPDVSSTGLGARLITAFARQLNGQVEASEVDGIYHMTFSFPVPLHEKPVKDY
jgi:two-component sensor histidine kinase